MASETFEIVRALVAEVCAVDRAAVKPDAKLAGFGLDSVRLLDLIVGVEEKLGLSIDESDPALGGVQTVADLVDLVERRRAGT